MIFCLGQFERKFGAVGSWQLGVLISLFAVPCSTIGFALALIALSAMTYISTTEWKPAQVAGLAATLVLLLSILHIFPWLVRTFDMDDPTMRQRIFFLAHAAVGFFAGGASVIILWIRKY